MINTFLKDSQKHPVRSLIRYFFPAIYRPYNRKYLSQNIDTISSLVDHFLDASDLPLDMHQRDNFFK